MLKLRLQRATYGADMDRFEDISDDIFLMRALEELDNLSSAVRATHEKNKIMRAAFNQIGSSQIMGIESVKGAYGYIPIDLDEFFDMIFLLEKRLTEDPDYKHSDRPHRPISFIEVGCGIGRNLHLLRATDRFCFEKVVGFDIVPEYIEAGQRVFELGDDIFIDDALEFDYSGYDVVYFYRPFSDEKMQRKFEKRIIETLKPSGYIVASLSESLDRARQLIRKDDRGRIWKRL